MTTIDLEHLGAVRIDWTLDEARALTAEVIAVDDFDPAELEAARVAPRRTLRTAA